jgi:hypothetical protein
MIFYQAYYQEQGQERPTFLSLQISQQDAIADLTTLGYNTSKLHTSVGGVLFDTIQSIGVAIIHI